VDTNPFDSLDDADPLDTFDGLTRLFPLPNVVLFPGVMQPLHIFEPRYREMVADAMDSDRLITMVLLKPGYEDDYEGSPPIHEIGCLGQIVHHEFQDDGRSNLILRGLTRVRIDSEEFNDRLYRTAGVSILEDEYPPEGPEAVSDAVRCVLESMIEILTLVGRSADAQKIAGASEVPAGRICDLACHCLGFDVAVKQSLLAEQSVARRAETLLAWMLALLKTIQRRADPHGHPPEFSQN
jgi:Lon protease-like protein